MQVRCLFGKNQAERRPVRRSAIGFVTSNRVDSFGSEEKRLSADVKVFSLAGTGLEFLDFLDVLWNQEQEAEPTVVWVVFEDLWRNLQRLLALKRSFGNLIDLVRVVLNLKNPATVDLGDGVLTDCEVLLAG